MRKIRLFFAIIAIALFFMGPILVIFSDQDELRDAGLLLFIFSMWLDHKISQMGKGE